MIPNISYQAEAVAGSSSVIFTATDRKIIEERGREKIDRTRAFKEIFSGKELMAKVENEETTIKPEPDIKELEGRYRDHQRMLKNSPLAPHQEKAEISNPEEAPAMQPDVAEKSTAAMPHPRGNSEKVELHKETAALAKELNLNPNEILDKFALEQKDLHSLIYRIKELHLKRLLCDRREEFEFLSDQIKKDTLAAGKPEARKWLEAQLDQLTRGATEYKLKFLRSLQSMGLNDQQEKSLRWLQTTFDRLSNA